MSMSELVIWSVAFPLQMGSGLNIWDLLGLRPEKKIHKLIKLQGAKLFRRISKACIWRWLLPNPKTCERQNARIRIHVLEYISAEWLKFSVGKGVLK